MPRPTSRFSSRATSRTYNPVQSKELQVPLILICKDGSLDEKGALGQGMRGQRDSVQLMLGFFQRIFFNGPLCPLDFDLVTLIKAVTGVSAEYYSLMCTLTPGAKLTPTGLIDLVRPLALSRDLAAVGSPLTYHADSGLARIARIALSFFSGWVNPLSAMGSECLLLPRECTVYRLWSPPGFTNSFLEVEAFSSSCQPILLHPDILRSYIRPAKKTLFNMVLEEWFEDGFLTQLIQRRLPHQRIFLLSKSVCSLALPFSSRGWLRFSCVTWLKHFIGLIARVIDFKAWWGVRLHCLILSGVLFLTPTILIAFITSAIRVSQTPAGPALLHLVPFFGAVAIPCIYFISLLIASLSQKQVSFAQRWLDLLINLVLLPVCAILVPLIALWSSDKISSKFYYSGSGPSYKFMKPIYLTSPRNVTKSPTSLHLSLASPNCFSPHLPYANMAETNIQSGFDWRFREELVHHALSQDLLDILSNQANLSDIELAYTVPFRYFPDWQAMLSYFRPDITQSPTASSMGHTIYPNRSYLKQSNSAYATQKTHSVRSIYYLDPISTRGSSTLPSPTI
ncbi:hypothetical protein DSO57_1008255 [Entomophthora muscae]|uniref:Uncharacterized protein n=1 Tax=Entomophthora muscae TaxID=34485 RepID=A0ACC2TI95_9FUNG|nr:hypothetical protein DSO57_1008255 [Entomophthora muscae]